MLLEKTSEKSVWHMGATCLEAAGDFEITAGPHVASPFLLPRDEPLVLFGKIIT